MGAPLRKANWKEEVFGHPHVMAVRRTEGSLPCTLVVQNKMTGGQGHALRLP